MSAGKSDGTGGLGLQWTFDGQFYGEDDNFWTNCYRSVGQVAQDHSNPLSSAVKDRIEYFGQQILRAPPVHPDITLSMETTVQRCPAGFRTTSAQNGVSSCLAGTFFNASTGSFSCKSCTTIG